MYLEHSHFCIALTPKSASTTVLNWCIANSMQKIMDDRCVNKPMFSIFRNHRDRIISGIAEDLFRSAVNKHTNWYTLSEDDKNNLLIKDIEFWAINPAINVTSDSYHYGNLQDFLPNNIKTLEEIHWIKFEDVMAIDKIIVQYLNISSDLVVLMRQSLVWQDPVRPSKEWYYDKISKFPDAVAWIEKHINSQLVVETI
jgi:hypothetical protein